MTDRTRATFGQNRSRTSARQIPRVLQRPIVQADSGQPKADSAQKPKSQEFRTVMNAPQHVKNRFIGQRR
jgi:hypothetical protein